MKTLVILGAGQMGMAAFELVKAASWKVLAIGDNDPDKWTCSQDISPSDIPVICPGQIPPICPVKEALACHPDMVLIGLMGEERSRKLMAQARQAGYGGTFTLLSDLYGLLDFRGRTLRLAADRIRDQKIPGCVAELGVYKGDTARLMNLFFPDRTLYLFDTFEGFDERDLVRDEIGMRKDMFKDTSADLVAGRLPFPEKAVIRKGYFPDTAEGLDDIRYAFVSLDPDLYAPLLAGLSWFYPRLNPGGMILVHDYNNKQFPGAKKAVHDFEKESGPLKLIPLADLHGSCVIIK